MYQSKEEISMKRHTVRLVVTALLLSGLVYFLTSCEREDDFGDGVITYIMSTGEPVTVHFMMQVSDIVNGVAVRNAYPVEQKENALSFGEAPGKVFPVADGLSMHVTLKQEDAPPIEQRSQQLGADTTVRVIAYAGNTIVAQTDYKAAGNGMLVPDGMPPMIIPAGTYTFVAYSYNTTAPLPAFNDITNMTDPVGTYDLIRGATTTSVGLANNTVQITMDHLFSQIKLRVESNITAGDLIHNIGVARFKHTFPRLDVLSSGLTATTSGDTVSFTWQNMGTGNPWISNSHYVYPDYDFGGDDGYLTVKIDSVWIQKQGEPTADEYIGPWEITYDQTSKLAPGYDYEVLVNFRVLQPGEVGYGSMVYLKNPLVELNTCHLTISGSNFDVVDDDYINIGSPDPNVDALVVFKSIDGSGNHYICAVGQGNGNLYNYVFTYNPVDDKIMYHTKYSTALNGSVISGVEVSNVYHIQSAGGTIYTIDHTGFKTQAVTYRSWSGVHVAKNMNTGLPVVGKASHNQLDFWFEVNNGVFMPGFSISGMSFGCIIRWTNNSNFLAYWENSMFNQGGLGSGGINMLGNILGESLALNSLRSTFIDFSTDRYFVVGNTRSLVLDNISAFGGSYPSYFSFGTLDADVGTMVRNISVYDNNYLICNRSLIPRNEVNAANSTAALILNTTKTNSDFICPYVLKPF